MSINYAVVNNLELNKIIDLTLNHLCFNYSTVKQRLYISF